ncbi:MAG: Stage III sporulation protein AE [Hydrogenibacillus schlegelii]|uniref:Stage III sporulation protein AE n=3 Tax=Hydrogenibacillus schlegelii TaxID=1484 RepID=A0A2T5GC50_HYDSH|nr:stage III sporulation protein AE [Hydrogenibacillus schlegelii]PTQ53746.1 MAG: Stage III sporulation protein AE [Hydrogenibacillus schlegelii]
MRSEEGAFQRFRRWRNRVVRWAIGAAVFWLLWGGGPKAAGPEGHTPPTSARAAAAGIVGEGRAAGSAEPDIVVGGPASGPAGPDVGFEGLAPGPGDGRSGAAALLDRAVELELRALDLSEIEQAYRRSLEAYRAYLPPEVPGEVRGLFREALQGLPWSEAARGVFRYAVGELVALGGLISTLLLLTVFSTVLEHIQGAFEHRAVSRVAQYVTFLILSALVLDSFRLATESAHRAIQGMEGVMVALLPVLLSLLAATGGGLSSGLFHPLVLFFVHTSAVVIDQVVFPLFFFSAVLALVSLFSEQYAVTNLGRLLNRLAITALSVFFTVFLGVLSVQGTAAAVADGVALRTAKYVVSSTVPVFGRMFSDATETVMGAAMLLKNAVGLVGVFLLFLAAAYPAAKVFVIALVYQFSAAVLQPLENGPVVRALESIGGALMFMFAVLTALGMMFFLSLVVILVAANASLFAR